MRIGRDRLRERRAARAGRVLVTGGAGFLGSHFAVALLRAGHPVTLLVRSSKDLSARDRVARIADWFGLDGEARRRLAVAEGDILDPGWGAGAGAGDLSGVDEIVHCASSTSFAERRRPEVEAANIEGLGRVLDFAVRGRCSVLHHVSTAYAAGKRTGVCKEDWIEGGEFTNVYEETKARGEILARDACRGEGIRLNVYRPTIVYGDSRTGRTLRFNALYYPVKAAVRLRDIYLADIRERGGAKAAELGIRLAEGGRLVMPLRIAVGREGGLNLVPVDHCVDAFMALFEESLDGGIYHIANPGTTGIEDLVGYARRYFGLEGIEACGTEAFGARPKNALEALYEAYLDAYRPYMQDPRVFDGANAAPILRMRGLACPAFDEAMFARCMAYAVETDWGSRLPA